MKIKEIRESNIEEYEKWVDPDMAENMSRMYFRGIACTDDAEDD